MESSPHFDAAGVTFRGVRFFERFCTFASKSHPNTIPRYLSIEVLYLVSSDAPFIGPFRERRGNFDDPLRASDGGVISTTEKG